MVSLIISENNHKSYNTRARTNVEKATKKVYFSNKMFTSQATKIFLKKTLAMAFQIPIIRPTQRRDVVRNFLTNATLFFVL